MSAINLDTTPVGLFSFLVLGSAVKLTALGWMRRRRGERFQCVGRVHALYSYPVKSCAGLQLSEADAGVLGLEYRGTLDRHWMVMRNNEPLLSRCQHRLQLVSVTPLEGEEVGLEFQAPGMSPLAIHTARLTTHTTCRVYQVAMDVLDCGDEAADWFSEFLGKRGARLVYSPPHLTKREALSTAVPWTNTTRPGDLTAFNFLTSYMLTSASSLHDLNQRISSPVSMMNFRPNIVIEGTPPYDEDTWTEIQIGERVHLRVVDMCVRCARVTVDLRTGEASRDKEPLTTLRRYRCQPGYGSSPVFGVYCALDMPGKVKVGDSVYILRKHVDHQQDRDKYFD